MFRQKKASIIGSLGRYKSEAYQAVSTTLPEGCSSGFVHWFPVGYFLHQEYSSGYQNMGPPRLKYSTW